MVYIGDRKVGGDAPCFITFEAGPTHQGLESAKKLVRLAAENGADGIKFMFSEPELIKDKNMLFEYQVLIDKEKGTTETVFEPLYDIHKRRVLKFEEWAEVKELADELGIVFFASVPTPRAIEFLVELGCSTLKIASVNLNNYTLLKSAAESGLCVQIDTGNASTGQIEASVNVLEEYGAKGIIIHHCPGGYPVSPENINLRMIPQLKTLFGKPVAFSDHSSGKSFNVAAYALGASLLEKTITEDKTTRSVEHLIALEPHEMKDFVETIRLMEIGMGGTRRKISSEQLENGLTRKRCARVLEKANAGDRLKDLKVDFMFSETSGIYPELFLQLKEKKIRRDIPEGEFISFENIV